jgi:ssDNA-binding Zn-finger/Zn-ribbon topoisomerase 1
MVIREGRRGKFLGCTGYPKCKNTGEVPAKLVEGLGLNGNGQAHAEGNGKANGSAKGRPAPQDTSEDDDIPTDLSVE